MQYIVKQQNLSKADTIETTTVCLEYGGNHNSELPLGVALHNI